MRAGCRISSRARKARQIGKASHLAQARHRGKACRPGETCYPGEACYPSKAPPCKTCRAGAGRVEPVRLETGRAVMRSREIPDRRGCRTYRRIRRREERPQRRRVSLQSSACAADRAEIESRRLYRNPVAADRGQGQAQPGQARCRGQRYAGQSLPVDPPRFRAHQIPRGVGVRGQEARFQRPLRRLFRVRLPPKSGLQDQPRLRRTGRPRKSRRSACPMPSNTASRSWAGTATRC